MKFIECKYSRAPEGRSDLLNVLPGHVGIGAAAIPMPEASYIYRKHVGG